MEQWSSAPSPPHHTNCFGKDLNLNPSICILQKWLHRIQLDSHRVTIFVSVALKKYKTSKYKITLFLNGSNGSSGFVAMQN